MTDKYKNKYRISSTRLQNWNYSWNGKYFVTICTGNRHCYFGDIIDGEMNLSEIGKIADKYWAEIPEHFPFVLLDEYIIMPNHVHGIVVINKQGNIKNGNGDLNGDGGSVVETRHCLVSTTEPTEPTEPTKKSDKPYTTIGQKRFQNQGRNTLSSIIGSYKSVVTKYARNINPGFCWQSRFHDNVIQNYKSLCRIRNYIKNNPKNWKMDRFNTGNKKNI